MSNSELKLFTTDSQPPFNTVGLFTYLRTYARRHDENNPDSTVESWDECLSRVVQACNTQLKCNFTNDEMQELFELLYNLKCSVAGRFLWQLGTKTVEKLGAPSLQNCAFVTINEPVHPFTWTMNMLMLGCVPKGSLVCSEQGLTKIEDLKVGDKVWSYNVEKDVRELKTVTQLHDPIVKRSENIKLECKFGSIISSKKHPILVNKNGSWGYVPAGDVKKGDILMKATDKMITVVRDDINDCLTGPIQDTDTVVDIHYNLDIDENWKDITVEDNNNYFVGEKSYYCSHNSGVGYRLLPSDLEGLPTIKYALVTRKETKDADYIVPDSREGWIKLLGKVMKAHFYSGKSFTYSCVCLRGRGAPIRGFGGVSSGPEVLCDGMDKINKLLNRRAGQKLRPIDALDIMNTIGYITISGNVRRSAQISLGDPADQEFLRAKRWDLGSIPNTRCYSNNSVICNDIKEVLDNDEFWEGYNGNGEPYGLINLGLSRKCGRLGDTKYPDPDVQGMNPSLRAGTKVLTDGGIVNIETLQNTTFKVKNLRGKWSEAKCWLSGRNKQLYKIILESGVEYYATPEHKWPIVKDGSYTKMETKDIKDGMYLPYFQHSSLVYDGGEEGEEREEKRGTYEDGFCIGWLYGNGAITEEDGRTGYTFLVSKIDNDDYSDITTTLDLWLSSIIRNERIEWSEDEHFYEAYVDNEHLHSHMLSFNVKDKSYGLPDSVWTGSENFRKGFVSGIFSNGGYIWRNQTSKCISISGVHKKLIHDIQILLGFYGIMGEITLINPDSPDTMIYVLKYSSWNAISHFGVTFVISVNHKHTELLNLLGDYDLPDMTKTNKIKIKSVELTDIYEDVWDVSVFDDTHCFQLSGSITGNCSEQTLSNEETCCLAEIFLPNITDSIQLQKCATYLYRICKHSLTLQFKGCGNTQNVVHKNMRMGIGVTGYLQSTEEQKSWLSGCYEYLREFDRQYSMQHGFPPSVKLTTCKPSGCMRKDSLILTNKGLLRLDEIGDMKGEEWQDVEGLYAYTDKDKLERITKFYVNGEVDTISVLLSSGMELECSHSHRFRVLDGEGKYVWRYAPDLEKGDRMLVREGNHPTNLFVRLNRVEDLEVQPTYLSTDIARFLGMVYSRGGLHRPYIQIIEVTREEVEWLFGLLTTVFGIEKKRLNYTGAFEVVSEGLIDWFEANFSSSSTSSTSSTSFPSLIRRASKEVVEAFILGGTGGGHWEGEDREFGLELLTVCRSTGIRARLDWYDKNHWILAEEENRDEQKVWNDFLIDTVVHTKPSRAPTYDIEVENSHHYISNGVISHNTLSLLGGTTSGVHPGFSRYYIRRIRIASESALVAIAREHGYHVEPVLRFDGSHDPSTMVIEFPYTLPEHTIFAEDCTAIDQLEYVKRLQTEWSDNAVSVTVYYRKEELPDIKEWLRQNYNDCVKSVSFLLHSEHGFQQAPLEAITQERYEEMMSRCRPILSTAGVCYNEEDDNIASESMCAGGVCPVK